VGCGINGASRNKDTGSEDAANGNPVNSKATPEMIKQKRQIKHNGNDNADTKVAQATNNKRFDKANGTCY